MASTSAIRTTRVPGLPQSLRAHRRCCHQHQAMKQPSQVASLLASAWPKPQHTRLTARVRGLHPSPLPAEHTHHGDKHREVLISRTNPQQSGKAPKQTIPAAIPVCHRYHRSGPQTYPTRTNHGALSRGEVTTTIPRGIHPAITWLSQHSWACPRNRSTIIVLVTHTMHAQPMLPPALKPATTLAETKLGSKQLSHVDSTSTMSNQDLVRYQDPEQHRCILRELSSALPPRKRSRSPRSRHDGAHPPSDPIHSSG